MVNTKIRLIIFFCSQRWRSSIQSAKTRQGADCGPDHDLLITKSWLKWKKVGKTIRSIKYDGRNINNLRYADDTILWQKVKKN